MPNSNTLRNTMYLLIGGALIAAGVWGYPYLRSQLSTPVEAARNSEPPATDHMADSEPADIIRLTEQARTNLGLRSSKVEIQSYWKKNHTTGIIVDRPGLTDRNITSPVNCVVSAVHATEGDIVRPGSKLFTLRIVSEYLQQTQSDYFKAYKEIELVNREIERIKNLATSGVIPEKRIINLQQDIARQQIQLNALCQELVARGFDQQQLAQVTAGKFITSIDILTPSEKQPSQSTGSGTEQTSSSNSFLEVQDLMVELGQQIKAGEVLAVLANHNQLYINGYAFKKEAANIARAAENDWDVSVDFLDDAQSEWPALDESLRIRHLSNTIDAHNRTFDFFIPLTNQSRQYTKNDETFVVWRFRPGQRVRIHVPVEKMDNVIVVPIEAVVYDGADAYVFQQNGELYQRIAVSIAYRDRLNAAISNDGSLLPGFFIAENSAASLNRILKVQSASGDNSANFHIHADGSVHANH